MTTNETWLIAGLGNPETKYDGSRHNAGFAALDYLSDKWNIPLNILFTIIAEMIVGFPGFEISLALKATLQDVYKRQARGSAC